MRADPDFTAAESSDAAALQQNAEEPSEDHPPEFKSAARQEHMDEAAAIRRQMQVSPMSSLPPVSGLFWSALPCPVLPRHHIHNSIGFFVSGYVDAMLSQAGCKGQRHVCSVICSFTCNSWYCLGWARACDKAWWAQKGLSSPPLPSDRLMIMHMSLLKLLHSSVQVYVMQHRSSHIHTLH